MKRLAIVVLVMVLTTACNANTNNEARQNNKPGHSERTQNDRGQVKTGMTHDNQRQTRNVGAEEWQNGGLVVEKVTAKDAINDLGAIPSEPDMEREEKVLLIVQESEKYIGKELDNTQFIKQVYESAGLQGFTVVTDIPKASKNARDLLHNVQPGDIVYFDLNEDGLADHYAIKLGNGDIIHAYTNGKIRVTNIEKETFWQNKVVYVQRVF